MATPLSLAVKLNDQRGVNFTPSGVDFSNPNSFYMRGLLENRSRSAGDQWQWQGNLVLDTDSSLFPKFMFGLRYGDRSASSVYGDRYASLVSLKDTIDKVPTVAQGGMIQPGFQGDDVQQFRSWFAPNAFLFNQQLNSVRDYIRQALVRSGADAGTQAAWARAAQPQPAQRLPGARAGLYRLCAGQLRLQHRHSRRWRDRRAGDPDPQQAERYQPVADLGGRHSAGSDQLLDPIYRHPAQHQRAAALHRPAEAAPVADPGAVAARFQPDQSDADRVAGDRRGNISYTGNGGNPNLQPIRSDNYDASLEYYFSRTGSVSVAGFYRKINGFINSLPQIVNVQPFGDILVYRPSNAGSGTIKGIEVAGTTFFDFLPGALRGLGARRTSPISTASRCCPRPPISPAGATPCRACRSTAST